MTTYIKYPNVNTLYFAAIDGTEFELKSKTQMIELRDRLLRYFDPSSIVSLIETIQNYKPIKYPH